MKSLCLRCEKTQFREIKILILVVCKSLDSLNLLYENYHI